MRMEQYKRKRTQGRPAAPREAVLKYSRPHDTDRGIVRLRSMPSGSDAGLSCA